MFTGIVENQGTVLLLKDGKLRLSAPWKSEEIRIGQSIAVNGCCLTVIAAERQELEFDLSPETFLRTTFGDLKPGHPVNLERALKVGDGLEGHLTSGHIDAAGRIRSITADADSGTKEVWVNAPAEMLSWLIPKGSVAVDGVSLTVNEIDANGFCVSLIPHTLKATTLGARRTGDFVNIEFDLFVKYVDAKIRQRQTVKNNVVELRR